MTSRLLTKKYIVTGLLILAIALISVLLWRQFYNISYIHALSGHTQNKSTGNSSSEPLALDPLIHTSPQASSTVARINNAEDLKIEDTPTDVSNIAKASTFILTPVSGSNAQEHEELKQTLNTIAQALLLNDSRVKESDKQLEAFFKGEDFNKEALAPLTSYSRAVLSNLQSLENSNDLSRRFTTVQKEIVSSLSNLLEDTTEVNMLAYVSAVHAKARIILETHYLVQARGITFSPSEPGNYFLFTL